MYGIFMECWVALKLYFGNPLLAILLVASAIYIIVTEKDWKKKILLGILPLVILAGFLFPVTKIAYVAAFDESDTYYRVLWLVPMYVVIGYAVCKLVFSFGSKMKQRIALVVALVVVVLSGHLVYLNQYMSVAQNLYHIPQHVIDICDVIAPADGEDRVRAAFPSELVHFVRQYDTDILMPYGREMVVTQWDYYNPVYEVMEKPEVIDAEELLDATRQTSCRYIVLAKDRKINKNLTTLGLKLIETIDNYYIYEDPEVSS
ncbi:hypothetical protein [Butyrivibrio sp. VCB2001]|uniref:hypothetical protein n=1 Tax=Butyrivibrio sp. VCB2001 TaxID=1280667 RepID=UPI00040B6A12|nr:hypothetical protein [Butyrivibrio sp. VCB2001]